jgi:methylglutamate dehydrogenase subunit C
MTKSSRLPNGGSIDRQHPIEFTLDGKALSGFKGDTVASALLANDRWVLGRSFKYHRPRGLLSAGVDEPNALLTWVESSGVTPNLPATQMELSDGLNLKRQNGFPSVDFDLMAINGWLSPLFGAGFYYKTFMGLTKGAWMFFEPFIRRAAGLGQAVHQVDEHRYDSEYRHVDVLIVGAGIAGVAAARQFVGSGLKVLVLEQDFKPGGELNASQDQATWDIYSKAFNELLDDQNIEIKTRTTAMGLYDDQCVVALDRRQANALKERLLIIRARSILMATGALERPLTFADNDMPGVLLSKALAEYAHRYAVLAGRQILLATQNDTAYDTACSLARLGAEVTLCDARATSAHHALARQAGVNVLPDTVVARALGGKTVEGALILTGAGPFQHVPCDVIGMSGGLTPCVHLSSHQGIKPQFNESIQAFVPGALREHQFVAGSVTGALGFGEALSSGEQAALRMLAQWSMSPRMAALPKGAASTPLQFAKQDLLVEKLSLIRRAGGKVFVDFQNDVTLNDVASAVDEGYESIEHLKRYTTLGMGTDQGKSSNLNALMHVAHLRSLTPSQTGTTTYRPPVVPLTVGAIAGRNVGRHFRPIRRTPLHEWHLQHGATMTEAGLWLRPWFYDWAGSDVVSAYVVEMDHVRTKVGLSDVSSLGKIDVQGPDAAFFLDQVYVNGFAKLPVGKARYGVMLHDDGIVLDDGTTARLAENHYFLTTTTAQAAEVMSHLEFLLDVVWPQLKVRVSSITDQWAGMSLAGPLARQVLLKAFEERAALIEALPFMGVVDFEFESTTVRLMRLSFSGELAYELYIPANFGIALWEHLLHAGQSFELKPYGLESLASLRIEKGHVAGLELDHRNTLKDLGLARMAKPKPFIGKVLSNREELVREDRWELVGLKPVDPTVKIRGGSILFYAGERVAGHGRGYITSVTASPTLNSQIALGLLEGGLRRQGQTVIAAYPLKNEQIELEVVSPVFLDPEGARLHA